MSTKRAAISGFSWSGVSQGIVAVLSFMQTIVLARLLPPEDFGLFAIASAVLGIVNAYADMGMGVAVIQRQDPTREQLSSLYWLDYAVGSCLFAFVLLGAQAAAGLFGEPRLGPLIMLAAAALLIAPTGRQFNVLLQKSLEFKSIAQIEAASAFASFAVTISMALLGYGVYALIWGYLIGATIDALLFVWFGRKIWWPAFHFTVQDIKGYAGFGFYELGKRTINIANQELDKILIGGLLGAEILGYYSLAFGIALMPIARLSILIMRVIYPIFSKMQTDPQSLKEAYLFLTRILCAIFFPVALGIAVTAPWFVRIVLGPQWEASIFPLQIISCSSVLMVQSIPGDVLLLARGHAARSFWWTLITVTMRTPMVLAGALAGGLIGIAWAILAFRLTIAFPFYRIVIRSQIGACFTSISEQFFVNFALSAAMALIVYAVMQLVTDPGLADLILVISVGAAVYGLAYYLLQPRYVAELRKMLIPQK